MNAAVAVLFVFLGCCSNVVFLELLIKEDPGSGHIITFSQFLFISIEGFIFTARLGTKKPRIGIKDYMILVTMFFIANVCNNYAFNFNIPMPLHMIFRAGSLIANMVMGILILHKVYTFSKYLSITMITVGIVICTVVSGNQKPGAGLDNLEIPLDPAHFFWWTVGILLLTVALFVSARMGIYQEVLYGRYGKYPAEALYYTHILPLPGFLILYKDIYKHFLILSDSESVNIPVLNIGVPILLLYLMGNVITQYFCISSVFVLTTECSSLTVTLVVTLRKFLSLLFSILYFKNPFTIAHWIGTLLVFSGTLIFTEVPQAVQRMFGETVQKKKAD